MMTNRPATSHLNNATQKGSPHRGEPHSDQVLFEKMHSLHNYIIVLYAVNPKQWDCESMAWKQNIQQLCSPWHGLGAHQVMVLFSHPDGMPDNALLRIWNADGSEAGACGNGTRCVFYGLWNQQCRDHDHVGASCPVQSLQTPAGWVHGHWESDRMVTVTQGRVVLGRIRQCAKSVNSQDSWQETHNLWITLPSGEKRVAWCADVGNPHGVIVGPPPKDLPLHWQAEHEKYPLGVNISFVWFAPHESSSPHDITVFSDHCPYRLYPSQDHWRVATWERGVGLTPACASGSCATAAVLHALGCDDQWASVWTSLSTDMPRLPEATSSLWKPPYCFSLPGGDIILHLKEGQWSHSAKVVSLAQGLWTWPHPTPTALKATQPPLSNL